MVARDYISRGAEKWPQALCFFLLRRFFIFSRSYFRTVALEWRSGRRTIPSAPSSSQAFPSGKSSFRNVENKRHADHLFSGPFRSVVTGTHLLIRFAEQAIDFLRLTGAFDFENPEAIPRLYLQITAAECVVDFHTRKHGGADEKNLQVSSASGLVLDGIALIIDGAQNFGEVGHDFLWRS